jgi:hypothetical protein
MTVVNPIVAAARKQLEPVDPAPFSLEALKAVQDRVEEYIDALLLESVAVMRRNDAVTISPEYVRRASKNIVEPKRRGLEMAMTYIGGACLSSGISLWADPWSGMPSHHPIWALCLLAIGLLSLGYQMSRFGRV